MPNKLVYYMIPSFFLRGREPFSSLSKYDWKRNNLLTLTEVNNRLKNMKIPVEKCGLLIWVEYPQNYFLVFYLFM